MKTIISTTTFFLLGSFIIGQTKKDVNVDFMLRGYFYASSAYEDTGAFGGFGGSDNSPKQLFSSNDYVEKKLYLKIDISKSTTFAGSYNGYTFYIVNKTDSIISLGASDSRLSVIAEAFIDNKWQAIEYLPSSFCGNSYHRVFLKSNQYWEFAIPKYTGKIKTKVRYSLYLGDGKYLYSNEISASINKKQLTEKEGHDSEGLMDPYTD